MAPDLDNMDPKLPPPNCAHCSERNRGSSSFPMASVASSYLGNYFPYRRYRPRGRTEPCFMDFHEEWQHPNCQVMGWYQMQTQSSTMFNSIQHWSMEGPFFHEYLLIRLTDGAACRVERMGGGPPAYALRGSGITARDIIEWFPAEHPHECAPSEKPPRLIIEVHLPQPFDLLDVLAICYSIQRHRNLVSYTLQRYNCYFLCSTILAILTRRIGRRESSIIETDWTNIVATTLNDLSNVQRGELVEILAFGIFSLINPDSQEPAGFVLESLRSKLHSGALNSLNCELSGTLWHDDWSLAIENGLMTSLGEATRALLDGSDSNSALLRSLVWRIGSEPEMDSNHTHPVVLPAMSTAFLHICFKCITYLVECKQKRFNLRQLELEVNIPLHMRLANSVNWLAVVYQWIKPKALNNPLHDDPTITRLLSEIRSRYHVNLQQIVDVLPASTTLAAEVLFSSQDETEPDCEDLANCIDLGFKLHLENVFPLLRMFIDAEPQDLPEALSFLKFYLIEDFWQLSVWSCVLKRIRNHVPLGNEAMITINQQQGSETGSDLNVASFQDLLLKRIQDHAQRVDRYQLGAASLVQADIKNAITNVWRTLPAGFGGCVGQPSLVGTARRKLAFLSDLKSAVEIIKHLASSAHERHTEEVV